SVAYRLVRASKRAEVTGERGLTAKNTLDQGGGITEIGDHYISAHSQQPLAFPFIEPPRAIIGFVTGHSHGEAADFLCVLNFHVTISESEQLRSGNMIFMQNSLDDHLFGEVFIVIERAINMASEI